MLKRSASCLIVDDNRADARLIEKYILKATHGAWKTTIITDYESAHKALLENHFHISIIDLNIAGRSGLDMLVQPAGRPSLPPAIIVSALADDLLQETALSAGAYDFIPKDDIDEKTLKRTIRHVFSAYEKERELKRIAARERQGSAVKSAFLACMSHDLRTPLNAIIGFADMLHLPATGPNTEERITEYARIISDSGQHLLEVINTILDLSKIEEKKFTLHREWICPKDYCTRLQTILKPLIDEKFLTIDTNFDLEGKLLLADARSFRQIFINVMSNAIKFSHSGDRISVSCKLVNGECELSIADTGVGMSGQELKMALTSFGQATRNPELARQGTGLGLTITKALMEEHGGKLRIDSRKDVGTRVTMNFPKSAVAYIDKANPVERGKAKSSLQRQAGHKGRALSA